MVAIGDIYELAVTWRDVTGTQQMINVYHFRQKAGFLSAINLIGEWQSAMQTRDQGLRSSGAQLIKYSCRSLIPHNTDWYETTLAVNGTLGAFTLPPSSAAIITWRTGLPGRRKRGRTYIGGVERSQHAGGLLTAAYTGTNMANFGNQVLAVFGAAGSSPTTEMGVWSRLNAGPDPPFNPAGFQVITGFTAQPALGTMGTRRHGRGV